MSSPSLTSNSTFTSTSTVAQLAVADQFSSTIFTLTNDSPTVTTVGGGIHTRLVLVDSGANILFAETSTNITNVRNEGVQVTGINGISVSSGVGKLPPMVLNTGHVLSLMDDCAISKSADRQEHTGRQPRTIITPKHLNEIGISVYFANGTTVLMRTDSVVISGEVIHQEKFSNGLALITVMDTVPGKAHFACITPQTVNTKSAFPGARRAKLKPSVVEVAIKTNRINREYLQHVCATSKLLFSQVFTARSKFDTEKDSWKRWHAKLGHLSLTAMRKAVATNPVLTKILAGLIPENCACESCMTSKVQMHPHNHGHAHLGGHKVDPGERVDFDNSGPFAVSVNKKRYRFLAVDYCTGYWYVYHAAKKSEAPTFFLKCVLASRLGPNGIYVSFGRTQNQFSIRRKKCKPFTLSTVLSLLSAHHMTMLRTLLLRMVSSG